MLSRTRLEYALLALLTRKPVTANTLAKRLADLPLGGKGTSPGAVYPAIRRLETAGLVRGFDKPRDEVARHYRLRGRGGAWSWFSRPGRTPERRYRAYALTEQGWDAVRRWASRTPRPDAFRRDPEELLLRFLVLAKLDGEAGRHEWRLIRSVRGRRTRPKVMPGWKDMLEGARPDSRPSDAGLTREFLMAYADAAHRAAREIRRECEWSRIPPSSRHPARWVTIDVSWEHRLATQLLVALLETRAAWARRAASELPAGEGGGGR